MNNIYEMYTQKIMIFFCQKSKVLSFVSKCHTKVTRPLVLGRLMCILISLWIAIVTSTRRSVENTIKHSASISNTFDFATTLKGSQGKLTFII